MVKSYGEKYRLHMSTLLLAGNNKGGLHFIGKITRSTWEMLRLRSWWACWVFRVGCERKCEENIKWTRAHDWCLGTPAFEDEVEMMRKRGYKESVNRDMSGNLVECHKSQEKSVSRRRVWYVGLNVAKRALSFNVIRNVGAKVRLEWVEEPMEKMRKLRQATYPSFWEVWLWGKSGLSPEGGLGWDLSWS